MKYILFTYDGRAVPIAKHLVDEGQEVTLCLIEDPKYVSLPNEKITEKPGNRERRLKIGEGFLNRIPLDKLLKVLPSLDRDKYFLFFDDNALYQIAEKVAPLGFPGNYPTKWDRQMEIDRDKAKEFVKANYPDVKVAEYHEFKKIEEAEKFLEDTDKEWVLKGFSPNAETVVPSIDDIELAKEQILDALKTNPKDFESEGFLLEEYIPNPIEITPESVWYNGELLYTNIDLEYKKIGAGDVGYNTGCSGDFVFTTPINASINKISFPEVVSKLAKQHKGLFIWDISLLVDKRTNTFYFGEFCFDKDTEVLTESGWKTYQDLSLSDKVLSLNPNNQKLEWKPITRIVLKHHKGEMVKINTLDALVTPDHLWWLFNDGKVKRVRAKDLKNLPNGSRWHIPRTGIWEGINQPELVIPAIDVIVPERTVKKGSFVKDNTDTQIATHSGVRNYGVVTTTVKSFKYHTLPEIRFKMTDFAYLLGLYLAEGNFASFYKGEPRVLVIAQSLNSPKRKEIEDRLKQMPIKYTVDKKGNFVISNRRLVKYFWDDLGLKNTHADTKFVPKFFKELAPVYLEELLKGYLAGDGSYHKKQWIAITTSKRLADDIQEIFHKIGQVATITVRPTKGTQMNVNGKNYTRNFDIYIVSTRSRHIDTACHPNNITTEMYNDITWDVTVQDNESLMVRRNGKVFISSNCPNRIGVNAFYTELTHLDTVSEFFEAVAQKKNPFVNSRTEFASSVTLFNLQRGKDPDSYKEGIKIKFPEDISQYVWVSDAYMEDGVYHTIGSGQMTMAVTGIGNDIIETINHMFENVKQVSFAEAYYRYKTDFLDTYPTSIMSRYYYLKHQKLIDPQLE